MSAAAANEAQTDRTPMGAAPGRAASNLASKAPIATARKGAQKENERASQIGFQTALTAPAPSESGRLVALSPSTAYDEAVVPQPRAPQAAGG